MDDLCCRTVNDIGPCNKTKQMASTTTSVISDTMNAIGKQVLSPAKISLFKKTMTARLADYYW
jgi:hypothetical protein